MRKYSILFLLASVFVYQPVASQNFETADEAVGNMRIGWNLGNTLDSNSGSTSNMWIEAWTDKKPENYETAWGQPITTRELIHMFKEAGFNAIRVPVTWYPHYGNVDVKVGPNSNGDWVGTWNIDTWSGYEIDSQWMARVKEVVDYVIDEGMYCIINVHHDTGDGTTSWIRADENAYEKYKERFETLWTKIAIEFRDYGERLLFEGYNEMLDGYGSWCFASFNAPGNFNAASSQSSYNALNNFAQSFVDAVRATGGNNEERNLVVTTYGACNGLGSWNSHLKDPLTNMKLPNDEAQNHIIFEVHAYFDIVNLSQAKSDIKFMVSALKKNLVKKGAPVIIGEWGSMTDSGNAAYDQNIAEFARYFVEETHKANMVGFYWMTLSDGDDRKVPRWSNETLKEAIVKGYYGDEGYTDSEILIYDDNSNEKIFNLQGISVDEPSKQSIYIKGRKKYLQK